MATATDDATSETDDDVNGLKVFNLDEVSSIVIFYCGYEFIILISKSTVFYFVIDDLSLKKKDTLLKT